MHQIVNRIRQHYVFFAGYVCILLAGLVLLFAKGKAGSFLALNAFHRSWLDHFFINYTYFGDGLFCVVLSLFLFFVLNKRVLGCIVLIAYASTGILTQIIKPIVESPRPLPYFAPRRLPFFIDYIIHSGNNSFPSGHTVSAFAIATVMSLFTQKKWLHVVLLLLSMQVGFSRIYLSQHFLTDVLAGSFIGVAGGIICVHLCRNLTEEKLVFKKG